VIIEKLYRKINGSLDGLDDKIGPAPSVNEATQTALPASEQPKTESTEQKPVEGTHPVKQP
ncbi:MAG: hypothetical protein QOJ02_2369, partial [Acidobacteriota bacterium]|nr:hypothetical protein [Acidobacteriota bacterium]